MATNDPTWGITGGRDCAHAVSLVPAGSIASVSLNTTTGASGSYFQWQANTNNPATFTFSNLQSGVGCEVMTRTCSIPPLAQGSGSCTLGPVAVASGTAYVIFIATDPTGGGCNLSITN